MNEQGRIAERAWHVNGYEMYEGVLELGGDVHLVQCREGVATDWHR